MSFRIERGILDRLVNQGVLGKRVLGKPFKYNVAQPVETTR